MSEGPLDAPIVICGRDWGWEEQQVGKPFVGAAGKLLNRALAKAGLRRVELLITNVVNKRPPGNKWEAHRAEDIDRGVAALAATLGHAPRALVVALGAEAFQATTGHDPRERPELRFDGNGITELRGYVFDGPYGPVLAATHPAFVLRTWLPWWPCLCWDLAKAKRLIESIEPQLERRESVLEEFEQWPWEDGKPMAVDIETAGEHAEEIRCVGWAQNARHGYAMPYNTESHDYFAALLASSCPKIFHNGQFDVTILERHGLRVNNWTDDTMLLFHTLEPLVAGRSKEKNSQTQKSLRFLASVLTDEPWWKEYRFSTEEDQLRLCARDSRITFQVWTKMRGMLETLSNVSPSEASHRVLPATERA